MSEAKASDKRALYRVTNNSHNHRVIHAGMWPDGVLVRIGETKEIELNDNELTNASADGIEISPVKPQADDKRKVEGEGKK